MRSVLIVLLGLVMLTPGVVSAGSPECEHMTRNIQHFERMLARSRELDSEMWEEKTADHVEFLKENRAQRCPEHSPSAVAQRQFMELVKLAAKGFVRYMTFGAF